MSKAKKKGGTGALSRQPSLGATALELEERARDEMCSIEAIYADDYTLVSDTPGQPLHFQVRVRPLPNESDAANFCIVLLDVMLVSSSPMPLLVLRKAKGVADALVEELQRSVDAEAARLIAKGEEAIVYQIVCFLTEALQPYNVAPKSFHQQMTEREANAERIAADQAAAHMEQQAAVRNEEKEALKKSIEAANAKKQEKLLAVTAAAGRKPGAGAQGGNAGGNSGATATLSSCSITASPASVAASPAMLSSSPPFLPSFNLGAAASAAAAPTKKTKASAAAATAHAAASSTAVPALGAGGKSAAMSIPSKTAHGHGHGHAHGASVKVGAGGGGGGKKDAGDAPKVRRDAKVKLKAKAQDKLKGRHKPRELREAPSDEEERSDRGGDSDDDDSAGSGRSSAASEDDSEDEDSATGSQILGSEDEESLFGTPGTSLTDKPAKSAAAGSAGVSSLDKLMQEIEARDAAANKSRVKAAASAARKKLLRADVSVSDLSGAAPADDDDDDDLSDSEEDEDDETDEEDEDGEEEDDAEDRSPTPAGGVAAAGWMDRNVSGNSDAATPLPKPPPALPYYSRFHTDFEVVELLGKGGFGEVFKVRNKVDRLYYAVKRIKLTRKNHAMNAKIIKEVSFIAMLHHRYIVRYYQAWIEGEENTDAAAQAASKSPAATKPKTKAPKPPGLVRRKSAKSNYELAGGEDDEDWLASSHPSTRVANDDEDDDDESDEDDDDDEEDDSKTAAPVAAGRQYLYIQMEYCANQTLRDVIDSKTASMEDCWRLFRQLLEAVAYIHKRGVLHRDLKPANVFISLSDSISQVKLGDFGLAVLSSVASGAGSNNVGAIDPDNGSVSDLETTGALSRQSSINECVGTHFYSAPEQAAQGVTYDHRVDMYSCGIILFEMVYPFGSLMERALQLEELRSTGKVPNEFLVGRPDRLNIIKIIESLLKHRPEDRPSAAELLKSGLIPLKVEDELVEEALKSVATRDSLHHTRLLDILFGMPPESTIDFTFDYLSVSSRGGVGSQGEGTLIGSSFLGSANSAAVGGGRARLVEPPLHFQSLVQMKVFDTLTHLFRNHGAIHLSPPIVTPKSSIGGASNAKVNSAVYLDPQGTLIKLPYTLTVPFARYIAQQSAWTWSGGRAGENLDTSASSATTAALAAASASGDSSALADFHFDLRRYEISKVYRKNIIGGRPREMYECGFDIVWSNAYANQMAGAGGAASSSSSSSHSLSASSSKSDARSVAREKLVCLSAELIKLTCDVLTEFMPAIGTAFTIKINHADLFESVLDVVLAEPNSANTAASSSGKVKGVLTAAARQAQREDTALLRKQLCKLASSYALFSGSWQKSPMRRQLLREKKLASSKIDLLGALFSLKSEPGKPESIFPKIRDTLFSSPEARAVLNEQRLMDQFDYIRSVFAYLKVLHHSDAHVVFDLSICGKHDLYTGGLVFQALVPNTNFDLGTGSAASVGGSGEKNARGGDTPNTPEVSAGIFSGGSARSGAESQTQNAYETLALGGQYDALIAGFMPPTASVPLSALGVNFAVEKIVSAVVWANLKSDSKSSRAAANPVLHRRIKKSLYGGDLHSSNILLFSSRNGLLKERLCLADALWTDHLPCLYIHPPHLNLGNLRLYAKEYMIRFLVVFRRQEFRDTAQVHVIDLAHTHASNTKIGDASGAGGTAGSSGSKSSKGGEKDDAACWINVHEVPGYLRSKFTGKGAASDSAAASSASSSSHHHSSSGSNSTPFFHAHSQSHRKPEFYVHIVDASSFKVNVKNTILANVKRALNAVLGSAGNPAPGSAVCAVDLPFALIRALTSAVYAGGSHAAVHAVLDESHAKHRAVADTLVAYINKKSGGALSNADAASAGGGGGGGSSKQSKSSAPSNATLWDPKEKVDLLYIFSIPDKKIDMIVFG